MPGTNSNLSLMLWPAAMGWHQPHRQSVADSQQRPNGFRPSHLGLGAALRRGTASSARSTVTRAGARSLVALDTSGFLLMTFPLCWRTAAPRSADFCRSQGRVPAN